MNKKFLSKSYFGKNKKVLEQIELCVEHSHKICVIYNGWDKKKVLNPLKGGQKPRFDCIFPDGNEKGKKTKTNK